MSRLKHLIIGPPLPTQQFIHERLNKIRALATFSPDALSSIAYANQEIFLGLVVAGSAGLSLAWPIGVAITVLLTIVALSYYQTIAGYPSGGGSYVVARENLGTLPGLVAGAALLIDYILTAAVSLTAGVEAIASAFPALWTHRIALSLGLLVLITLLNLRGLRETGTFMSIPVYLFLFTFIPMLVYGFIRAMIDGPGSFANTAPSATVPLTAFLVLRAFSAGCTALTGIEAVSNGVPAFHPPQAKNAQKTLIAMAVLMGLLFVGSIGLTQYLAVVAGPGETILSSLTRRLLGGGTSYLVIQIATMLILAVAANTGFAGFPRLAALLAKDEFLPHQFTGLGDRLVLANGIIFLSSLTGVLIIAFKGNTHSLIPLFAVGAFLAFTLSQTGMVMHWCKERGQHWQIKALLNGLGALVTGITTLIVGVSKFRQGAWLITVLIPVLVILFYRIRCHYQDVAEQLTMSTIGKIDRTRAHLRVVIPISGVHRGVSDAINYAQSISKNVTAVYIELEPGSGDKIIEKWNHWWPKVPLVILPSPYRSIVGPLLDYLDQTDEAHGDGQLATVILPEFIPSKWWHSLLHNQTAWLIKAALLYRRRHFGYQRAIIDVPYHLER
ncbi:MAG: APC family permease [Chloroflexi bacterium]|nr:APC family permease [Chloroflexota bacterium]